MEARKRKRMTKKKENRRLEYEALAKKKRKALANAKGLREEVNLEYDRFFYAVDSDIFKATGRYISVAHSRDSGISMEDPCCSIRWRIALTSLVGGLFGFAIA
ncbi:unnamed protein product [Dovyalis caffra]|uniref:Uncharacterized protein n=1 Tax=Dovyalis caffra TaxID=77055 RepID=A0AAV1SNR3_9ROSI|nr:unnamed protein product [Dovyalis caffra]